MPKVESTSADKVAVDYDVEHYRPKNRVTPWPTPDAIARRPAVQAYQFGENGDDPDEYLSFDGPTVGHRSGSGYEDLRSQVVVDFFELDTREDLLEGRCMLIQLLCLNWNVESLAIRKRKAALKPIPPPSLDFPPHLRWNQDRSGTV